MVKGDTPVIVKATVLASPKMANITHIDPRQAQRLFSSALLKSEEKILKKMKSLSDETGAGGPVAAKIELAATPMKEAPGSVAPNLQMEAHVERIAAAIAEVTANGATADVHLALPKGATPVDGAIIGRDTTGALHITLTSPNEINAAQAAQLQASLHDRLRQRDLRIGNLNFQRVNRRR